MSAATSQPTGRASVPHKPPPDARSFWRILLAVLAPVPPLALAVSTLVAPYPVSGKSADVFSGVAADPGRMQIALWFTWLFILTIVPATIAVAWVCRRRAPRLTAVGGFLALLGFAAAMSLPAEELAALVAAQESLDRGTILALNEAMWNRPVVLVSLLVFLVGMVIGGILLGIALWRSRVAPRWMALALIVSSPLHIYTAPAAVSNAVAALSWALAAVGYAAATLALLRMNNDVFDLPPVSAAVGD